MRGAREVIARGLGGVGADERGAGCPDALEQLVGISDMQRKVFGTDVVSERAIASRDGTTRITPFSTTETSAPCRVAGALPVASLLRSRCAGRARASGRCTAGTPPRRARLERGDQRRPSRVRGFVAQDQDLARARDAVDADLAIDQALGARDVAVTRTDDFVDFGDGLGAIGEGADGLRAARVENPGDPREVGRGQKQSFGAGVARTMSRTPATRGGHRRHEHAGRVAGFSAGRVHPHPGEGAHECRGSTPSSW